MTRLLIVSATLFLAAGLTVFLPYFSVEVVRSAFDPASGHTYRYTGVQLLSSSYGKNGPGSATAATYAGDGRVDVVLVLVAVALGLATLMSRRHRRVAWALAVGTVIVLVGGCASTIQISIFLAPEVHKHLQFGFVPGALLLMAATIVRVVLWRVPIKDTSQAELPPSTHPVRRRH